MDETWRTLLSDRTGFIILAETDALPPSVAHLTALGAAVIRHRQEAAGARLRLVVGEGGLALESEGQTMVCGFEKLLPRLRPANLTTELLVRAAKVKTEGRPPLAVDATAGMGEDALLLAAAGFEVILFERDPVIAALLLDAVSRARQDPRLSQAAERMQAFYADSLMELPRLTRRPDVIYLDPMFPAKTKSALTKKKFQLLHQLELPCQEEEALLSAAAEARPKKIVVKRPLKGAVLGGRKPSYSLKGKAVRYDCIVLPERERGE